ncbi:MAG TPA: hypothetical protein VG890_05860 [Puia sp.]|nr:hypothetical protein [Puia sp.]
MENEIELTVPKDCYILCEIFRCIPEDTLLFYMKHVSVDAFLARDADRNVELATGFFLSPAEPER